MLSVAEPPDPSCSCEVPALKSDERAHPPERSSSLEADPAGYDEGERPRFSIRDFVSEYRSKDIRTNWPFPQQHLQLCLKHGIIDLLPPFEPPDLLRTQLRKKYTETKHLFVCSEAERTQPEVDLVGSNPADLLDAVSDSLKHDCSHLICRPGLGSSRQLQDPLTSDQPTAVQAVGPASEDKLICEEAESKVTVRVETRNIPSLVSDVRGSVQETTSISESSSELEAAKPLLLAEKVGSLCEPSVKKCRLLVKVGGASLPDRLEDIVSNLSSVSDPMASKICPVCKIFSSTSNTTLNAHIDQCLSVESSAKQVVIKLSQHKVKPRKKRSMEDICATAPRCTLEDLDRRNGTNWALELNSVAQNNEISSTNENKKARNSPLKPTDDEIQGAVYVDSHGTKLLILSKFNDAPSAAVVNCPGTKEFEKEYVDKQTSLFCKKKTFSRKHRRYLKDKVQRNKISLFNHLKGKIHKEDKFPLDTHHEEEMISQASNVQGQIKTGKPRTLGQWISSKRSSLLKHSNSKFSQEKPENQLAITHQTSMEDDQTASCAYYARGCSEKLCRSSGDVLSSKKIKSTVMLSNAVLADGNQKNCSANLPEKNDRSKGKNPSTSNSISTRKCGSSANSRRMEIHANAEEQSKFLKSTKCFMGRHPRVHKAKTDSQRSLLMDGPQCPMETIQCNEVVQGMVSKKLRKRRFAGKAHKVVENSPLEFVERFHGSPSAHGLDSASNNVTSEMRQSSLPENVMMSETSDTFKHMSPYKSNTRDSNQADVQYYASGRDEFITLNHSHTVAECHHDEAVKIDGRTEVSANMESVIKYFLEKPDGSYGGKIVVSENHEATTCDRLDSCPSLEYPRETSSANEATTVTSTPELLADHGMFHGVIASDVVTESSVKDDYCSEIQKMEYQADVASILVSGSCLTRPGDKVLGIDTSPSMNLSRTITSQIHNMVMDTEPSGSPVSATSTISHLSVEDLKSYDVDREPSEEPVVIQEMPRSGSGNLRLLAKDSINVTKRTDLEKTNRKMKALASSQEPEKFWHGQLCCCSRRESILHKPKILRQSVMAGMVLPTKTKQMTSSLYIRPVMPSSPAYSYSRSEMAALSILNSPPHSISGIASPDLAVHVSTFNGSANPSSHIQPLDTSAPVLRLMGKNLIVNREERPVQLKNWADPCNSVGTSNAKYASLLGFSSTGCFSKQGEVQYHPCQLLEDSVVVGQQPSDMAPVPLPEGIGCSAGTLLRSVLNTKTGSHGHQYTMDKTPGLSGVYNLEKVCPPHERQKPSPVIQALIPEREVIVIDDCSEHEPEPSQSTQNLASTMASTFSGLDVRRVRAVPCYPSQNLSQSRELGCDLTPGFPSSYPMNGTNPSKWGSTSGSSDLLQRPSVVPSLSAGQLTAACSILRAPSRLPCSWEE